MFEPYNFFVNEILDLDWNTPISRATYRFRLQDAFLYSGPLVNHRDTSHEIKWIGGAAPEQRNADPILDHQCPSTAQ